MMNNLFGKIAPGMAKISMNGEIAIKTATGYKTYDVNTNTLVNVDNFAFDAPDMFFVIPTNTIQKGDIILANGTPKCIIAVEDDAIKAFSYEDGSIVTLVPEHHVFFGKSYYYGKIMSMFGNLKEDGNLEQMMKFMMMSQMMGGKADSMMPMMFMMNPNMLNGMFDQKKED